MNRAQLTSGMRFHIFRVIENMNDSPQDLAGCCSIQQSWSEAVGSCYSDAERFRDPNKYLQRKLNDEAGVAEDIHVKRALFCVRPQHDQQTEHEHRAHQQRQCCDARQRAHNSCKYCRHDKAKKQRHCAPPSIWSRRQSTQRTLQTVESCATSRQPRR